MNLALGAAALTGVQVGAAIVASRLVAADVPPLTLAMLRYAIGFLCLLPFVAPAVARALRGGALPFEPRDMAPIALLGIGQFALLIALLNFGLRHVGAAQAALIFSLFPLLTLLLAALLGHERVRAPLLAGVVLSVAGVAISLVPKLLAAAGAVSARDAASGWWGEAAVFASACTGAACSVLYRPYLRRYAAVQVSGFAMLASVALLAVLALGEQWPQRVAALGLRSWSVVGFIGLSSGVGYFLWLYALKHESATRVTVFLALNPVTAAVLGAFALHEPIDGWTAGATALIGAGLWLATRSGAAGRRGG